MTRNPTCRRWPIFLRMPSLEAGEAQAAAYEDCVQLMTLHSAKGLEFKLVFLCAAWKRALFPHQRSISRMPRDWRRSGGSGLRGS